MRVYNQYVSLISYELLSVCVCLCVWGGGGLLSKSVKRDESYFSTVSVMGWHGLLMLKSVPKSVQPFTLLVITIVRQVSIDRS